MKVFIVYAHPEPRSFNGAMYDSARQALLTAGYEVKTSDLYRMNFNPVSGRANFVSQRDPAYFKQQLEELNASMNDLFAPDIRAEQEKLEWCDLLLLQFPLWWFSVPAMMKGWVDRIFAKGTVYGQGNMYETGMLRGKRALLSLTTGGDEKAYLAEGLQGDIAGILRPLQRGILEFTGFEVLAPHIVYGPASLSDQERQDELSRWQNRLRTIGQEKVIEIGRYK